MKNELFERIVKWNIDRDNTNFSHFNETKMLAEELYEFCLKDREEAKKLGRKFAEDFSVNYNSDQIDALVDAAADMIFIAVGTIMKLGFDPAEVLTRVCDHNDKKGSKKDKDGKIIKDETFVEPVHVK